MRTHRQLLVIFGCALFVALFVALGAAAARAEKRVEGIVNINTASGEELQLLPGIGPAKVQAIVAYRRVHPFRTIEELSRIKGIGRKMMRKLRPHLAVSGPTTARAAGAGSPPLAGSASQTPAAPAGSGAAALSPGATGPDAARRASAEGPTSGARRGRGSASAGTRGGVLPDAGSP